ncbi:MAG: nucleotidyltransferase domain-containing protein [Deltaproteobacteria bacterium]|nr:nucleotidyltransferase domain-containing protein [Deltaproteobacteria bacterium]
MMSDNDRRVLGLFAERVRTLYPEARVLAYGSRARGDATWESDLDVCVIMPAVTREIEEKIGEISWEVGFDNDVLITAVEFEQGDFERKANGGHPFVANVLRDGVAAR